MVSDSQRTSWASFVCCGFYSSHDVDFSEEAASLRIKKQVSMLLQEAVDVPVPVHVHQPGVYAARTDKLHYLQRRKRRNDEDNRRLVAETMKLGSRHQVVVLLQQDNQLHV